MAYRITNSSIYEGYATLGTEWHTIAPGQTIISQYEPKNATVGISYTVIIEHAVGAVNGNIVDEVPQNAPAYTSMHQSIRRSIPGGSGLSEDNEVSRGRRTIPGSSVLVSGRYQQGPVVIPKDTTRRGKNGRGDPGRTDSDMMLDS
jgi:hypothetical protein